MVKHALKFPDVHVPSPPHLLLDVAAVIPSEVENIVLQASLNRKQKECKLLILG